jgi:hypothetical protein
MASIVEHNSRKSLDENFEKKQNLVMDPLQRCVVIVNCKKKNPQGFNTSPGFRYLAGCCRQCRPAVTDCREC